MKLKNIVKKIINKTGYDLYRINSPINPEFQLLNGLNHFGIELVFDIGANTGQFASGLRSAGYKGDIVSFEPLPDAYQSLIVSASHDQKWYVHMQSAIGDINNEIEINIAGNSVSSSILPMLPAHSMAAENSAYVGKVKVPIIQLDTVASQYLKSSKKYFIKIDTQGYEWQVLNGATETLAQAQGVLCELSLVPLYEGQRLWKDMIERFEAEGFTLWAIQKGFTDPVDGRTLQIDAIFFRC
jgi:FkbM family methyltransferase